MCITIESTRLKCSTNSRSWRDQPDPVFLQPSVGWVCPPPLLWSYCRTRRRTPQASCFHAGACVFLFQLGSFPVCAGSIHLAQASSRDA
uniref:Uncharacterized protein n=1 Tax=Arundo donax TaxID=35708 RepID=A0A0A9DTG3_ARUDO